MLGELNVRNNGKIEGGGREEGKEKKAVRKK